MCRLVAYLGRPMLMQKLLIEPKNSLINQSIHAKELEEPLNGDGFGVGWYNQVLNPDPGVFTSITPAWNNRNLQSIAPIIKSSCFMAHVRAASVGEPSESNCHPFRYHNLLMMHNGDAPNFPAIKRKLREKLSDELYNWIKGQTDSEHLFALFIDALKQKMVDQPCTAELMSKALEEMIQTLEKLLKEAGVNEDAYLNIVVTDGERMVGVNYVSDLKQEPLSLYYAEGARYECKDGVCSMSATTDENLCTMIVSEKLTDSQYDWKAIPANHFILVQKDLSVILKKVNNNS